MTATSGQSRRSSLIVVLVAVLFLALGALGAWLRLAPDAADDGAVALLFEQRLPDLRDAQYPLATLKGKTVVVNFWATWCAPCVEEMPELSAMQAEFATHDAQVIGIGIDSTANIRQFASTREFAYPLLVAGTAGLELARQLGNAAGALPYTVVIDPQGRATARMLGRFDRERLRKAVLDAAAMRP